MKKIGIITINDNDNYGNRLQNYATQEVMKMIDCVPETFLYKVRPYNKDCKILQKIKLCLKKYSKNMKRKRLYNFMRFNKNITFSYDIDKKGIYNIKQDEYDYFITGSDQVWNATQGRLTDVDLLSFANGNKRISFAASFGINELPEEYKEKAKREMLKYKAISVREDAGKDIITSITGRNDVEVLIDPTMMISASDWDKIAKKPSMLKKDQRYILNYFLGKCNRDYMDEINRVAKQNNCIVINIFDKETGFFGCGPSEFLYLEKNAFLVCTDSFHSCVFSIIYDTPFIVFDRNDNLIPMNSRLDTLLSKFELENRKFNGSISDDLLKCDYSNAKKILEKEKEKSKKFLCKALDINE